MGGHRDPPDLNPHLLDQRLLVGEVCGGDVVLALRGHLLLLRGLQVALNLGGLCLELRKLGLGRRNGVLGGRQRYQTDCQGHCGSSSDNRCGCPSYETHSSTFRKFLRDSKTR